LSLVDITTHDERGTPLLRLLIQPIGLARERLYESSLNEGHGVSDL
jgi:hypothetical protein